MAAHFWQRVDFVLDLLGKPFSLRHQLFPLLYVTGSEKTRHIAKTHIVLYYGAMRIFSVSSQKYESRVFVIYVKKLFYIAIKRKYKVSPQSFGRGKLTRWWFVIRGDEEAMSQL